jgi:hypothetical protein
MDEFTTEFGYVLSEAPKVRITAFNEKGSSESPSEASTGDATVKTAP